MITPARECRQINCLKARAHELGLCEYAKLYGDKRKRETWEKLLDSRGELEPLRPRLIEKSETRINWQFGIYLIGSRCASSALFHEGRSGRHEGLGKGKNRRCTAI